MIVTKLEQAAANDSWADPTLEQPIELVAADRLGAMHGVLVDLGRLGPTIRITQARTTKGGRWALVIDRETDAGGWEQVTVVGNDG